MNYVLYKKRVIEFLGNLIKDIESEKLSLFEMSMEKRTDPISDEHGVIEHKDNGMRSVTIHYYDKHAAQ